MRNLGLVLASTLTALLGASSAHADPLRVVVLEFSGPDGIKDEARKIVVNVIKEKHEIISVARFAVAARTLGVEAFSPRSIPGVARRAGIDAVIQGKISEPSGDKQNLAISVIESQNGRTLESLTVPVTKGELKTEARAQIADELVDVLDSVSPLSSIDQIWSGGAPGMIDQTPSQPVPLALSNAAQEQSVTGGASEETPLVQAPRKAVASRFRITAGLGLKGTKRSLSFVADPSLSTEMQPQGIDGNPAAAVALSTIIAVPAIGLSGQFAYDRSVGSKVEYRDAGMVKALSVSEHQLAAILRGEATIRTIGMHLGAGYREVAYTISGKPGSLTIPNCRYAFLDLGAGFRVPFRHDQFAVSGEGAYLYSLATSGITDPSKYGTAGVAGWRGDLGLEFRATESTTVRAGMNYLHISLAFDGTGQLQHALNGPNGFDVAAASDGYLGGYVLVGFVL